jgi:3-oxoacyl-[acyl-carrier protein] reductase
MSELAGKAALVTGGSRGIGAAIATRLAQDGADVALTYASAADQAKAVVAEIEAAGRQGLAIVADSAHPHAVVAAVERTADTFGRLDILVNNAGIYPFGPLEEVTLEEVDRTLAIHVRAAFLASQAAARHMGAGGRIITLYAMSKSALIGLTKGLARDLGARGITANLINPGPVDTDMNPADGPGADEERSLVAVGRFGRPEEIAAMVAHLVGEGGAFVTGATIAVDGGFAA